MVVKMNNKSEKFYEYMGKIFGSRLIQNQTNDRIYDDDSKIWYMYIKDEKVVAFVSISNDIIKNVYGVKEKALKEVLEEVRKENKINFSTVTNIYEELYAEAGFKVSRTDSLKNFVVIVNN